MSSVPARELLTSYLAESRKQVLSHIEGLIPKSRHTGGLYELILEYPLRGGKSIRPALCLAVCEALGGSRADALPSAAALELYHNAFLVHDDVEDGSLERRQEKTLHEKYGVPIAVNVGDATLSLAMDPLLSNIETVGLGRALRILETIQTMSKESAEGQMLELEWKYGGSYLPSPRDYVRMVYKKTCWYSFIAPVAIGAIAGGSSQSIQKRLKKFALFLGVSFQIVDDLLNLTAGDIEYGKEIDGDLWEGKYTLMLIQALNRATESEANEARVILRATRPELHRDRTERLRTEKDVEFLKELIKKYDGIEFAESVASRYAAEALKRFDYISRSIPDSVHLQFIGDLVGYVLERRK
ncbi:MAG: geranylgeranyl diphosphate synthase type II [Candidatus Azotimanducaceae bacterium]